MSTTPRGIQIKGDQATLLKHPVETSHDYIVITNAPSGLVLQPAIEALDTKLGEFEDRISTLEGRGTLAVLSNGNQVTNFASAYISDTLPIPPISAIDGSIMSFALSAGDIWISTTDNVIKRYESDGLGGYQWTINGAAYL